MEKKYWNERWEKLDLGSFDNGVHYEISNYGRLKSYAYDKNDGRLLKGGIVQGYRTISFSEYRGDRITRYVHKLVAQHFLPQHSEEQKFVIHLDFDKLNNHVNNLKWVTKEEKEAHQNVNPNFVATKSTVKYSKLTEAQVVLIKKALKRNRSRLKMIAKRFGITHTQLNRIKKGENWGYIKA